MKIPASIPFVAIALVAWVASPAQDTNAQRLIANSTKDYGEVGSAPRPEIQGKIQAGELQNAIGLSDEQTFKIERILTKEAADCQASGAPTSPIRQRARDDVRALLTPEQRANFNLIPQNEGGGLIGKSPWEQLDRLDKLVHLTPTQKKPVLDELIDRTENLMEARGVEQVTKRNEIRLVIDAEIRALLTSGQQKILDAALAKHREKADFFAGS